MIKKELNDEQDIATLIDSFYKKVLEHDRLAYFFTEAIHNWSFHKQQFIKYWSSQILFTDSYEGTPLHRHVHIDQHFEKGFTRQHFDDWAALWQETVEELFVGDKAELAKECGVNMAKNIYLKMFLNREFS